MKKELRRQLSPHFKYFNVGFFILLSLLIGVIGNDLQAQSNQHAWIKTPMLSVIETLSYFDDPAYEIKDISNVERITIHKAEDIPDVSRAFVSVHSPSSDEPKYTIAGYESIFKNKKVDLYSDVLQSKMSNNETSNAGPMIPQDITVSGTVTDSTGSPLVGVSVQIKGTKQGTITNSDGHYKIDAPENSILMFTYAGYIKKEVAVDGRRVLNVTLLISRSGLDEVVVVGYGTQRRRDLTGAISSVEMDDILGDRPINDAAKALQGTIPGLQITYGSGQPGTLTTMNIRGFESINGGAPLVLVDNVPMNIEDINPQDIKNVTVLKDASASAIYGARAAFGVVLITTKKGVFDQPIRFNYSTTIGFNRPSNIPRKASMLEFMQALEDWGQTTHYGGHVVETWKDYLIEYEADPAAFPDGYIDDPVDAHRYWLKPTNVVKDLFSDPGIDQYHNFSFRGGSQNSSYRASFGYVDEDGIAVTNKDRYRKYNIGLSLTNKLTSKLTTTLDIRYNNSFKSDPFMGQYSGLFYRALGYQPVAPLGFYEDPISDAKIPYRSAANEVRYSPARNNYGENIRLSGKATYHFTKVLSLIAEYTAQRKNSKIESESYEPTFVDYLQMAEVVQDPSVTSYSLRHSQRDYSALNIYGQYKREFKEHHFKLMLGMNQESEVLTGFSASRDMIAPNAPGLSTSTGIKDVDDSYSDWGVFGVFGRLNYKFKDRYLLEVNSRYDGSSRFPPGHRFGLFPSVSAGWIVTSEPFMSNLDVLSFLKIRSAWGSIGNQNISNYAYFSIMSPANAGWINSSTGELASSYTVPGLVSDNFTWETVQTLNIGFDLGLWDNRLYATFDWYNRKTLDMLAPGEKLPAVLGANAPLQNVADLSNKGWELDMQWKDRIKDLKYSIGFNLYDHQTEILNFNNPAKLISQYYPGQKIGEIWGYITDRYYTVDDFVSGTLNDKLMGGKLKDGIPAFKGKTPNPGDILYKNLDENDEISPGVSTLDDPGDRRVIGNSTMRFQFGINGSVEYKNVDLSFYIDGVGKRDLWVNNILSFPYIDRFFTLYKNLLDYWTPQNTDAFYPRNYSDAGVNYGTNRQVQTKYLKNGSYIRVKNITIGYTVPEQFMNRLGINRFRVFFSGENLFMFDHLPQELNPLLSNLGDGGYYPYLRKFTAGINLSF